MMTKLIKLSDDTLVEVDVIENEVEQISGGIIDKVNGSLANIKSIILSASTPIIESLTELDRKSNRHYL